VHEPLAVAMTHRILLFPRGRHSPAESASGPRITALPKEFAAVMALLRNTWEHHEPGHGVGRRCVPGTIPSSFGGVQPRPGRHLHARTTGERRGTRHHRRAEARQAFPRCCGSLVRRRSCLRRGRNTAGCGRCTFPPQAICWCFASRVAIDGNRLFYEHAPFASGIAISVVHL
jgi:hypothetical protein